MEAEIRDVRRRLEAVHRGLGRILEEDMLGELAAGCAGDETSACLFALLVSGLREQLDQVAARLPARVS